MEGCATEAEALDVLRAETSPAEGGKGVARPCLLSWFGGEDCRNLLSAKRSGISVPRLEQWIADLPSAKHWGIRELLRPEIASEACPLVGEGDAADCCNPPLESILVVRAIKEADARLSVPP